MGIGMTVGAGIFAMSGKDGSESGPALIVSMAFCLVTLVPVALCYADLSTHIPKAGSSFNYARALFGEYPAVVVSTALLIEYSITIATVSRAWSHYLADFVRLFDRTMPPALYNVTTAAGPVFRINILAGLLLIALMLLLLLGTRTGALANGLFVALKISVLLFFIAFGATRVKPQLYTPFSPRGSEGLFEAASTMFFAFLGFDSLATLAEDSPDPKRDLPIAIVTTLTACGSLYIAVAAVLVGLVPYTQLSSESALASALAGTAWAQGIVAAGAVIGILAVTLVSMMALSRLMFAMSREGFLPAFLSHASTRGPWAANVFVGLVCAVPAVVLDTDLLAHMTSLGSCLAFAVVCLGVIQRHVGDAPRTPPRHVMACCYLGLVLVAASFSTCFYLRASWVVTMAAGLLLFPAAAPLFIFVHKAGQADGDALNASSSPSFASKKYD
eukprot:g2434.t1